MNADLKGSAGPAAASKTNMETKWIIKPAIDKALCDSFPEYPPLILQLLRNRGMTDAKAIDEFFNPDYVDHIHDPLLLK